MDRKKTRRRLRNTGKSVHLPQELIEEILSALPAKSLLRFKCVSKSWRCLIESERFIKTQIKKSIKDPSYAHWRVSFNSNYHLNPKKRAGLKQCSVRSYFRFYLHKLDPMINRRPFDDSTNNHLTTTDCKIVGSCNGLLCILKEEWRLFLWNPTTRISIELPELNTSYFDKYGFGMAELRYLHSYVQKYGFGMDEQSGAYKVFAVLCTFWDVYVGKVYSSEANSWKTVEHGCPYVEDEVGVLVGGKLHWLTGDLDYIESFDLSSEVFEMIELPDGKPAGEDEYLMLREASGRLSVIYVGVERDVEWVRVTKGGAKEHWVKVKTAKLKTRAKKKHWVKVKTVKLKTAKKEKELKNILDDCGGTVYVESLVWPVVPLTNH